MTHYRLSLQCFPVHPPRPDGCTWGYAVQLFHANGRAASPVFREGTEEEMWARARGLVGGQRRKDRAMFYAIYREDQEWVFGPFETEEEAEDHAWQFSLRNGLDDAYGGSSTDIINEKDYRKRYPGSPARR